MKIPSQSRAASWSSTNSSLGGRFGPNLNLASSRSSGTNATTSSLSGYSAASGGRWRFRSLLLFSFLLLSAAVLLLFIPGAFVFLSNHVAEQWEGSTSFSGSSSGSFLFWQQDQKPLRGLKGANSSNRLNEVAICLFGGARSSEITLQTFFSQLLKVYSPADIFINSHLDENAAKIPILFAQRGGLQSAPPGTRLVAVRIRPNMFVNESAHPSHLLNGEASNGGVQGLLQQFQLIDDCWALITSHEEKRGAKYKWVVKTRLDSFWSAPPPPLSSLNPRAHSAPVGSSFDGLNDRFSICGRDVCDWSMKRLPLLPRFKELPDEKIFHQLDGEKTLLGVLKLGNASVDRVAFPFCLPPSRRFGQRWDDHLQEKGIVCSDYVYSIKSTAHLNGGYCASCQPCLQPEETVALLRSKAEEWRRCHEVSNSFEGLIICKKSSLGRNAAELHAALIEAVDARTARAARRAKQTMANKAACRREVEKIASAADRWLSPSANQICLRSTLGPTAKVKTRRAQTYNFFFSILRNGGVLLNLENNSMANILSVISLDLMHVKVVDSLEEISSFTNHLNAITANGIIVPFQEIAKVLKIFKGSFPFCHMYTSIPAKDAHEITSKSWYLQSVDMHLESCVPKKHEDLFLCTFYSRARCIKLIK